MESLDNDFFWICCLFVFFAIGMIPLYVMESYSKKHKMNFAEYNRLTISSFCTNECIYKAEFKDFRMLIPTTISSFLGCCVIGIGDIYNLYHILTLIAILMLGELGFVYYFVQCLFPECYMTNTLMLIRGTCTKNEFEIVPLPGILSYRPYQSGLGLNANIHILTKDGGELWLYRLKNRDQLIDVLRDFTNATELT